MFVIKHKISNRFLFGNNSFSGLKYARTFASASDADAFLKGIPSTNFQILPLCKKCKGLMTEGIALQNQMVVFADFIGDEPLVHKGATCSPVGDAIMVAVWKCEQCGHSLKK